LTCPAAFPASPKPGEGGGPGSWARPAAFVSPLPQPGRDFGRLRQILLDVDLGGVQGALPPHDARGLPAGLALHFRAFGMTQPVAVPAVLPLPRLQLVLLLGGQAGLPLLLRLVLELGQGGGRREGQAASPVDRPVVAAVGVPLAGLLLRVPLRPPVRL